VYRQPLPVTNRARNLLSCGAGLLLILATGLAVRCFVERGDKKTGASGPPSDPVTLPAARPDLAVSQRIESSATPVTQSKDALQAVKAWFMSHGCVLADDMRSERVKKELEERSLEGWAATTRRRTELKASGPISDDLAAVLDEQEMQYAAQVRAVQSDNYILVSGGSIEPLMMRVTRELERFRLVYMAATQVADGIMCRPIIVIDLTANPELAAQISLRIKLRRAAQRARGQETERKDK
jgi:hypothetical protein